MLKKDGVVNMYRNEYLENCLEENQGSYYLLRGYIHTQERKYDRLVINDLVFIGNKPKELEKFKNELVKANIKEFVLTESSSGLMANVHALDSVDIKIKDVTEVNYINKWDKEKIFIEGLKWWLINRKSRRIIEYIIKKGVLDKCYSIDCKIRIIN